MMNDGKQMLVAMSKSNNLLQQPRTIHDPTASPSIFGTVNTVKPMASSNPSTLTLKIEFGGGLELLFSNQRSHKVTLPATVPKDNTTAVPVPEAAQTKPADVAYLIHYLRDRLLQERAELFVENGTVYVSIASSSCQIAGI